MGFGKWGWMVVVGFESVFLVWLKWGLGVMIMSILSWLMEGQQSLIFLAYVRWSLP